MRTPELSKVLVEDRGKRWKKLWNIEESLGGECEVETALGQGMNARNCGERKDED